MTTSLIADIYGLRVLGTIGGVAYSFRQIGGALGVLLVGYLFDITGSYDILFAITGFLLLPAALVAFMVNKKSSPPATKITGHSTVNVLCLRKL